MNTAVVHRLPDGQSRRSAFTLVELLVAMGITALIAGLALSVFCRVLSSWVQIIGRLEAQAQAHLVFEQLTLDLQSAFYREDGGVWLAASVLDRDDNTGQWQTVPRQKPAGPANHSLDLAPIAPGDIRFGQAGMWLRFFTSARGTNDEATGRPLAHILSAPVAVAYQIVRRDASGSPAAADARYLLYRSEVRPAQVDRRPGTIESGYQLDPANDLSPYQHADQDNDGAQPGDPCTIRSPAATDAILAENVVDFGVIFYAASMDGNLRAVFPGRPDDFEYRAQSPALDGSGQSLPAVAEIVVRILTTEGARQIRNLESPPAVFVTRPGQFADDAEWWWGIVAAHSLVFHRRIVLPLPAR